MPCSPRDGELRLRVSKFRNEPNTLERGDSLCLHTVTVFCSLRLIWGKGGLFISVLFFPDDTFCNSRIKGV